MVTPSLLRNFYEHLEKICRQKGLIAGKSGRHMKYPYTFSAKVAQFPIFFYLKNNWIWMYYPLGIAVATYFISIIHNLANSESNIRSWQDIKMKEAAKEKHL